MMKQNPVDLSRVRRLLIIKLSAMGDVLHAIPVSAAIGRTYPNLEITWVVEESCAPIVEGNRYLSRIVTLPKLRPSTMRRPETRRRYMQRLREIHSLGCEVALDLQGLTKSALIAVASGAKARVGYHYLREASGLFVQPAPRRDGSIHVVDHYLDVARYVGAEVGKAEFPLDIPESAVRSVDTMLKAGGVNTGAPFVSINPAAGHPLKLWGAANYAVLADAVQNRLGLPVVMVTADLAVASAVSSQAAVPMVDLSGRTDIKQLMEVVRRSAVHVCGDTGSGHLAAAFERPVVSLIGPTDPQRVCPYGQRDNVITHRSACAASCTDRHCAFSSARCLEAITVAEVVARIEQILGGSSQTRRSPDGVGSHG
jgi:heptosyltransferase-1